MSEEHTTCKKCSAEIFKETEICPKCGVRQVDPNIKPKICSFCMKKFPPDQLEDGICSACRAQIKTSPQKSPLIALLASIVPGLGQVYIGQKGKGGFILLAVLVSIWIPIIGWILIPVLWIGGAVDAYVTAVKINKIRNTGNS